MIIGILPASESVYAFSTTVVHNGSTYDEFDSQAPNGETTKKYLMEGVNAYPSFLINKFQLSLSQAKAQPNSQASPMQNWGYRSSLVFLTTKGFIQTTPALRFLGL